MKHLILLTFLIGSMSTYAQDAQETCNQLPYAKVDQKAELTLDLEKLLKKEMHASLKEDGSHSGIIKLYVDCHGEVAKQRYDRGDLNEEQQQWLLNLIGKTTWKPAVADKKKVTSVLFLTVDITNGQAKVTL